MSDIRIGMIGLDTGHVHTFAQLLNKRQEDGFFVEGGRVVKALPQHSPDMERSRQNMEHYTGILRDQYGVEIVDSVEDLLAEVDAVMIESIDGRAHLRQFESVCDAGKPVFIDKPFTCSLAEAKTLSTMAAEKNVPVFSTSCLRYNPDVRAAQEASDGGGITGVDVHGLAEHASPIDNLFWYGIHGVEMLFTLLGPGCASVRCTGDADTDLVVGHWKDGRYGVLRGIRKGKAVFGGVVYREQTIEHMRGEPPRKIQESHWRVMISKAVDFFRSGKSPVPVETTVEIVAFIEAANASREQGGKELSVAS